MKKVIIVTLCLILIAGSVQADKTVNARRLENNTPVYQIDLGSETSRQDCYVGNLNAPAWAISGWFTGGEAYKFLFWPWETCQCPLGFWTTNIHIYLQFDETLVYPFDFPMIVDQEDGAWFDPCWWPGELDCLSLEYMVTIDAPGLYDLAIPIMNECDCSYMYWDTPVPGFPWGPYLISVTFPLQFTADLIVDEYPSPCTVYNDWGMGWVDLYDYGFDAYGNLVMYAEVDCCDFPVPEQGETWGSVKSLYR